MGWFAQERVTRGANNNAISPFFFNHMISVFIELNKMMDDPMVSNDGQSKFCWKVVMCDLKNILYMELVIN